MADISRGIFVREDGLRGTSPVEARQALQGLAPRAGILSGLTVTAGAGWVVNINPGQATTQLNSADGVTVLAVAAVTPLTISPAPGSGSRYVLVWIQQRDVDTGDADSKAIAGITEGTASASPVRPTAQVPAGALILAEILVSAGNANAAAAVITQVATPTAARGGIIVAPDLPAANRVNAAATVTSPAFVSRPGAILSFTDGTGLQPVYAGALQSGVPSYAPAFQSYSGSPLTFVKHPSPFVTLSGLVGNAIAWSFPSGATTMGTLPAAFWPKATTVLSCVATLNGSLPQLAQFTISTNGALTLNLYAAINAIAVNQLYISISGSYLSS